jgi:hypothetical protein
VGATPCFTEKPFAPNIAEMRLSSCAAPMSGANPAFA